MSSNEIQLFTSYLQKCHSKYFEWGCGGSTHTVCKYPNIQSVTSVDSSLQWINKVAENSVIRNTAVNFIYIDINADNTNFGRPQNRIKVTNWPSYSRSIAYGQTKYDLILIDGRFRVACALHALDYLSDNGYIIIHDYVNRPHYHCIEKFYDKIETSDTLVVMKKKLNYDKNVLSSAIRQYELICD